MRRMGWPGSRAGEWPTGDSGVPAWLVLTKACRCLGITAPTPGPPTARCYLTLGYAATRSSQEGTQWHVSEQGR